MDSQKHDAPPFVLTALIALSASMLCSAPARAQGNDPPSFVPNRLIVKFSPFATQNQIRGLLASTGARSQGEIPHTGVFVLQLPPEADEPALANAFSKRPEVAFAEVDVIQAPSDITPNDTYYK